MNKASGKSRLNTICRLTPLVIILVKYFCHLTRVLLRFPETKGKSKFTVPLFSGEENLVHSSVERIKKGGRV